MRPGIMLALVCGIAGCGSAQRSQSTPALSPARDSVTLERERYVAEVRRSIAGKETLPASQVFRNVKTMGELPAGRLLAVMNVGYGKSLGVSCTHCHVAEHWDSEDKEEKQVARDMMAMTRAINEDYVKKIKALEKDKPNVSCMLCHRGRAHAGEELRPPGPPPGPPPTR